MRVLLFIFLVPFILLSCKQNEPVSYSIIEGQTMGTYYRVTFSDTVNYKVDLDSILQSINDEVSTYIPESTISQFNKASEGITLKEGYFIDNLKIAGDLYRKSSGFYDPTVMPLVNYWGFGYDGKSRVEKIDSVEIGEIMKSIGYDKIDLISDSTGYTLKKSIAEVELDFSSVAKGYAVDKLGEFLSQKGVGNYLVDIGGEMLMKGKNPKGLSWSIGINTPDEEAGLRESIQYVKLSDKAVATSGNYRNFYESNGVKISHTINPLTGFPERTNLLSVTIIAPDCASADAWATACMVLGTKRTEDILKDEKDIDACLIYADRDDIKIKYLNNFKSYIATND